MYEDGPLTPFLTDPCISVTRHTKEDTVCNRKFDLTIVSHCVHTYLETDNELTIQNVLNKSELLKYIENYAENTSPRIQATKCFHDTVGLISFGTLFGQTCSIYCLMVRYLL